MDKKSCYSCKFKRCGARIQIAKHINNRRQMFPSTAVLNAIYRVLAEHCIKYKEE